MFVTCNGGLAITDNLVVLFEDNPANELMICEKRMDKCMDKSPCEKCMDKFFDLSLIF